MKRASVVLFAFSVACGGDGPVEPPSTVGTLSFSYTGAESGTFAVSGTLDPEGGPPASDGAAAVRFDGELSALLITGIRVRSATHDDFLYLVLPDLAAPRTFSLDEGCLSPAAAPCPFAVLGLNIVRQPSDPLAAPPDDLYAFTSGTVRVTSISANRVAGTFEGTASTLALEEAPRVIAIANGAFDVPIFRPPSD